uniref:Uncharacterized protein n=1 Tax=Kalmanozyma brasiliensis (strain GHG001) TaxID=1365824 RepID=V5ENK5_KALBG
MPPARRGSRPQKEFAISLSSDDEDDAILRRSSSRSAKGKESTVDKRGLYTNVSSSQPSSTKARSTRESPRPASQRSFARTASAPSPGPSRASSSTARLDKPRGWTPTSRRTQTRPTERRRKRQSSFVEEDDDDDLMNDQDDRDNAIEDSDDEVDIDDIIAEMNGGGFSQSSSQKRPTPKKTTSEAARSRTRASSSRPRSVAFADAPIRRRPPPRERFALLVNESDVASDDHEEDVSDEGSDDLRQELEDLNSDSEEEEPETLRRSSRHSSANAKSARSSGRSDARGTRSSRNRRIELLDDDDSEGDDFTEISRPSKSRGREAGKKTRRQPRRQATESENEDDDDDDVVVSEVEEEPTEEEEDDELEDSDGEYGRTSKPNDLNEYIFIDGIEPIYRPSDGSDGEQVDGEQVQAVSDDGSDSEEVELYETPEANVDRHWSTCKRCTGGPALPLYNKALTQLKRMRKREENKRRDQSPERIDSRGRQRKSLVEDTSGRVTAVQAAEEWLEVLEDRAGWFECKTCSVSWHWGCLPADTQKAILVGINRERYARHQTVFGKDAPAPSPVRWIDVDEFVDTNSCPDCAGYASYCTICKANVHGDRTVEEQLGFTHAMLAQYPEPPAELTASRMFRCHRCSRATHYECLARAQAEDNPSVEKVAQSIQEAGWLCSDCHRCPPAEKIIAWRQLDRQLWSDEEAQKADYAILSVRENLPREYLVKFKGKSFRDTEWVPHDWLRILHQPLLANFLAKGSRLELEPAELIESASAINTARKNRASLALGGSGRALPPSSMQTRSVKKTLKVDEDGEVDIGPPGPIPDAQRRIPKPWRTPDRILAVKFYVSVNEDDDNMDELGGNIIEMDAVSLEKLEPSDHVRSWAHTAKLLVKWQDQPYEGSTWEDPPTRRKQGDIFYECQEAYRSFLLAQKVTFPALTADEKQTKRERRLAKSGSRFRALDDQPHCIEGGDLIDFQLEGVNWLRYGWYHEKPGILADEMGLGKTVQIITFLASIWKESKAGPFLVVVPNATLPNWLREFEKWMPQFRVVPYWGEGAARDMISKYEIFHSKKTLEKMGGSIRPIKFHVVVASDTTVRIDSLPLRKVERWDVIIVDEGQNLKSGKSLLLKNLNDLKAEHRIIMTGTPLNNNVTELFNLLNWLEPGGQWKDVKALEAEYSVLKPEVIEELQKRLKPYFLRRLKKEVLDLPPKIELIVPTSLRPIQKRIYRSILESNIEDIQALAASRATGMKKGKKSTIANLNNTLMQLRKCIQHPYLIAPDLETREGEDNYEATWEHQRLIDASAKLSILQRLLPKLKADGHRVLLFSQFVIALDIVEVFLRGEGYKFLRLDGNIGQKQRQKDIDAFNAPDSPYFIYMISTRAGGVGINLATADTVIIMDPDWNPHVDMQAIARAHRIGQTKKLLVFTLMCKATAEEKIIEAAKRKMMLDHLIVQNLDKEDERPDELESILKFGAQALFAEGGTEESERDVRYTDEDLDSLLRRREDAVEEDDKLNDDARDENGEPKGTFSYARVWEIDQPAAEPSAVAPTTVVDDDFWADLLHKHRDEAAKRAEEAREREAQEKRATRRDRIKAMLQDDEAAEAPATPAKRGPGRPKKVVKPPVDEDFKVVDESDSDEHELIDAVQEEDELLPAVQALRQRQLKSSNAAIATAAAAAAAATAAAVVAAVKVAPTSSAASASVPSNGTSLSASSGGAAGTSTPAAATAAATAPPTPVKRPVGRPRKDAPASAPTTTAKAKAQPFSLTRLQRDLIAEHRLPRPAPLGDLDLSQPIATVRPGHLAAMRKVILSLLPDSDFATEVAERALSNAIPDLAPLHQRFQLTNTHIDYYKQTFNVPRDLFEATFSIIAEESIPPQILALAYGGAIALDWRKIRELLVRAATYMVLTLRASKDEAPWIVAIRTWNVIQAGKPAPAVIEIADSPPANGTSPPAPRPATAADCVNVLRDQARRQAWLDAVQQRGEVELTKIGRLVTSNPMSTTAPNMMLIVQNYMDGKGQHPAYAPAKLSIRSGIPSLVEFVDRDLMPPPTAKAASPAASQSSTSASQGRPNRVAAALSRLSAFSGGSPLRNDVSKKDLTKLDVAVNYRKPRVKTASSSVGGSPRSSASMSPSPALHATSASQPSPGGGEDDDDEPEFVISDQTCIICGGTFHYLNRCPQMQDVTRASARWFQLCDQLRVLTARGLTDGDPDVATIKTTIRVMALNFNGLRAQNGQGQLKAPFV